MMSLAVKIALAIISLIGLAVLALWSLKVIDNQAAIWGLLFCIGATLGVFYQRTKL